jgi:hypothetical protein
MDPNSPLAIVLGVLVGTLVGLAPIIVLQRWWQRRDRHLRELEDQIWLDSLPDEDREAIERGRQQRVEIRREARRRLGLPEEEEEADG